MKLAHASVRPMTTLKTYVWRVANNHNLQQNELVKKIKQLLIENNEHLDITDRSLGDDPKKVFCLHAVNPAVNERFNDMIKKGETVVYQGSGRLGFTDGLYAYILTGEAKENKPFLAFTNPDSIAKHMAIFSEKTSKAKLVFRSPELPHLRFEGDDTVGIYKRATYDEKIPVEVAFAREAGSNIIYVVSADAALTFLEELYLGLHANHNGILKLTNAMQLHGVETKHDFIKAFSEKLHETSNSPQITRAKLEAEALLKMQDTALKAGAEVAELLGDHGLSMRLQSLRESIGVKTRPGHMPEIKLYETHMLHHKPAHQHT